jgi:hypothetical protein
MDYTKFNTETLAKIWNKLNYWDWADELGDKPESWDTMSNAKSINGMTTKYDIVTPIMKEICDHIGLKECIRWHHLNNLNRTNEEFENWWENNQEIYN